MKILIDTNVILDVLGKRESFYSDSLNALQLIYKEHTPCVSTTTITDIIYLSKKFFPNVELQKSYLSDFFSDFKIIPVGKKQILQAFSSPMNDFEDAVQAYSAKRAGIKLIVTRNTKDFALSPVTASTPREFSNRKSS